VIVATQVLESMRTEPRPTRAEASDAAGAVDGGADAIMLSGETATGLYPVRSVEVLDAIIRDAETIPPPFERRRAGEVVGHAPALCEAAVSLSARSGAHAIVAVTREGKTAAMLSVLRARADIIAATDDPEVARQLNLWHGVTPLVCDISGDVEQVIARVVESAVKHSQAPADATMVVVNTSTDLDRGSSNFVRLRRA
jgi:pyruvate kinase